MRLGWKVWVLAIVTTFACASYVPAQAAPVKRHVHHRHARLHHGYVGTRRHGHVAYAPRAYPYGRGSGYAELVGDPESGVGFYPLPFRYRVGAWRYHMREASLPPWIRNGVLFAMVADAARYDYFFVTPVNDYKLGVYSPYEGWGTPYFPGWYEGR